MPLTISRHAQLLLLCIQATAVLQVFKYSGSCKNEAERSQSISNHGTLNHALGHELSANLIASCWLHFITGRRGRLSVDDFKSRAAAFDADRVPVRIDARAGNIRILTL